MLEEKDAAFAAYLLSIVGALYVLLLRRKEEFAVYHAKQSLGIGIIAIGLLIAWFLALWVFAWIPYVGFIFGIALFALVIAAYILLVISSIVGMIHAWSAKKLPVPVVGGLADRLSSVFVAKIDRFKGKSA